MCARRSHWRRAPSAQHALDVRVDVLDLVEPCGVHGEVGRRRREAEVVAVEQVARRTIVRLEVRVDLTRVKPYVQVPAVICTSARRRRCTCREGSCLRGGGTGRRPSPPTTEPA
eukprot:gene8832-biopygen768